MEPSETLKLPTIVIIGRPNVGKSSLFNRLLRRKQALVHNEPGVTRDRIEADATWILEGKPYQFKLIDTGGLGHERFAEEIKRQVQTALSEADAVIALFDGQAGLLPGDQEILRSLRTSGFFSRAGRAVPVLGVVNKVDADVHEEMIHEFYEAGLETWLTVSAEHDRGTEELKEALLDALRNSHAQLVVRAEEQEVQPKIPRIAIVGKPNVGKSTLVNALLGESRMVTSPIAGTTVDSVDSRIQLDGYEFVILDTAGIRRKDKTEQGVEVLSVVKARQALESCDVAILLLDGEHGVVDQDEKIGGLIDEAGCGVIIAVNKWDLQGGKTGFQKEDAAEQIRERMNYLRYAPVVFLSALKGRGLEGLGELVHEILSERQVRVSTKELTEWVREAASVHNPANAKFYLSHQVSRNPPTFVFHVSNPEKVHYSLRGHIGNGIRARWGYMGNPIRLFFHETKTRRGPRAKARHETAAQDDSGLDS